MEMKEIIGFIGLGEMGKWMALNIARKGFPLLVHDNRNKAAMRELVSNGAESTDHLSELGRRCSWVFLSLPDSTVVDAVVFGSGGLSSELRKKDIIIDCGTTDPFFTKEASVTLRKKGISFIDAPVSGMQSRAKDATLTIMVGGDRKAYLKVHRVLRAMGKQIVYLGKSGSGQLTKMANNVLFNISCAAMAEILPMTSKLGLDPKKVRSVVTEGTGQSFGFDFFSPLVFDRNFIPGYPMERAYKDMLMAIKVSSEHRIPMPLTFAAMQTYQMALSEGYGTENKGAMVKVWERVLGVEVGGKVSRRNS
jgi:3-hydroxyisobutyrate dehydrogenase-like beta-hydroxyacid dehydrogenase